MHPEDATRFLWEARHSAECRYHQRGHRERAQPPIHSPTPPFAAYARRRACSGSCATRAMTAYHHHSSVPSLKWGYKTLVRMISLACRLGELVMARQRIELAAEEAEELSRRARATTVPVRDRQRAEIILLSVQGLTQQRISEQLGISRLCVTRWVGRFALHRLAGLSDRAGRGRKPWLPQAAVQQVLEQAVTPRPIWGGGVAARWPALPGCRRPACSVCGQPVTSSRISR